MSKGQSLFNFGKYTFTSWARRGVGNSISRDVNSVVRARIPLSITLSNDPTNPLTPAVELLGPSDVASFSRKTIVRTTPLDGDYGFEWNLLPYVEFYDEDFLWRYTPDAPDGNKNLSPWLALVVLKEGEFTELASQSGALPAIRLQTAALPKVADGHLWAHMHTGEHAGVTAKTTALDLILKQMNDSVKRDPDGFTCRLMSPRRLEPRTFYHAFVIPAYESGRLAGLGEAFSTIDARQLAWTDINRPATLDFPIYHRWTFGTTEVSFEELVSRFKTASANPEVGIRPMDTRQAGYIKAKTTTNESVGTTAPSVLGLEGALKSPATVSTVYPSNKSTERLLDKFQGDIMDLLNLYDANTTTYGVAKMDGDPVLTIPLYGQTYLPNTTPPVPLVQLSIEGNNWYSAINFDPRNRVAAGLGTQVVQKNQEDLMQSAWEQLEVLKKARNNYAAIGTIMSRLYVVLANPNVLAVEDFFSMTGTLTARVINDTKTATVFQSLNISPTPNALVNSATRRILRANGNVVGKLKTRSTVTTLAAAAAISSASSALSRVNFSLNSLNIDENTYLDAFRYRRSLMAIYDPPADDRTAFSTAFRHFLQRTGAISKIGFTKAKSFDFAVAQKTVLAAVASAPLRQLKNKINLPNITSLPAAATPERAPAEFVGQPIFDQPMYEPLWKMDKEWLLPNVNLIENNTITLLETNPHFINSYMLGLNQELGREMLWREYPASLAATFFRNFWTTDDGSPTPQYNDIEAIQKWIGLKADNRLAKGNTSQLVLTMRGDLLRKFPNTIIFAASMKRVGGPAGKLQFDTEGSPFKFPKFRAELPPDLQFIGFDLTVEEIKRVHPSPQDRAWYFIIMEPVGEPHFGLDSVFRPDNPNLLVRNDLAWEHVPNAAFLSAAQKPNVALADIDKNLWGKDAATMANFLFQQPFALIIKATDLLSTS